MCVAFVEYVLIMKPTFSDIAWKFEKMLQFVGDVSDFFVALIGYGISWISLEIQFELTFHFVEEDEKVLVKFLLLLD